MAKQIQCVCGRLLNGAPCPRCMGKKIEKPKTVRRLPAIFADKGMLTRASAVRVSFAPKYALHVVGEDL